MKKEEGLSVARKFRIALAVAGLPVQRVLVYGSVAHGTSTEDSDLDIAVICAPFRETRHDENMVLRTVRSDIDLRISPYCFHPDDFHKEWFGLAQEVERTGVEVH